MGGGRKGGVEIDNWIFLVLFVCFFFVICYCAVFVVMCSLFLCVLAFVFVMLRCGWGQQRRS